MIAELTAKTKRSGVRTDTEADVLSGAVFKLHHTIYMINLIKQALIGLLPPCKPLMPTWPVL